MALHAVASTTDDVLQQLQRGEITLDEFLDRRVELALAHIRGRVSEERLVMLREVMREHVRTDPVVVELVRRATGQIPTPAIFDDTRN